MNGTRFHGYRVALALLATLPCVAQEQNEAPTPRLTTQFGCPVSPILVRIDQPGQMSHLLSIPDGEWLFRLSHDGERSPPMELESAGPDFLPSKQVDVGNCRAALLSVKTASRIEARIQAGREHIGTLYCLSVHPVRPRPQWETVLEQTLELNPDFEFPTLSGPRCAAPVVAKLEAGMRYRISVASDDVGVHVLVPAQNGLEQLDRTDPLDDLLEDTFGHGNAAQGSARQFLAPHDGVYVFWCIAQRADYRTRPRVTLQRSDPMLEGLFPGSVASALREQEPIPGTFVAWRRPDLWVHPNDPPLFVPFPSQTPATFTLRSEGAAAAFLLRAGEGMTHEFSVQQQSSHQFTITMLEGEPGVWLESKGADGPVDLEVRLAHSGQPRSVRVPKRQVLQLPIVLRGKARSGDLVSVRARGAGCAPQITLRGAGVSLQCMDPSGFSIGATVEGVAAYDGEVEALITATAADPGAIAMIATNGFEAMPTGSPLLLDQASLQWISTPGLEALDHGGEWTESDERLPSGTSVDWHSVPMSAGHVYRVLSTASQTPSMILDVPGAVRYTAGGGIAIITAKADGQATIGVAAAGSGLTGPYALQVRDLGPESNHRSETQR